MKTSRPLYEDFAIRAAEALATCAPKTMPFVGVFVIDEDGVTFQTMAHKSVPELSEAIKPLVREFGDKVVALLSRLDADVPFMVKGGVA